MILNQELEMDRLAELIDPENMDDYSTIIDRRSEPE